MTRPTEKKKYRPAPRKSFTIELKTNADKNLALQMFQNKSGLSKAFANAFNIQILTADTKKISCMGTDENRKKAIAAFSSLSQESAQGAFFTKDLINQKAGKKSNDNDGHREKFNKKAANQNNKVSHSFVPKNEHQAHLAELIENHDLVFAEGPAGTGKTHVAIAKAVAALKSGQVKKILLARPARESGESLGFLPGDSLEKMAPYMRPLYDELEKTFGSNYKSLVKNGTVEISPVGFMRGRTFEDSFIIMDEAQNTTKEQIKMALTRIGKGSKMVVTGDPKQIDLEDKSDSGLVFAVEKLKNIKEVGMMKFEHKDIVRSHIVSVITDALTENPKNVKSAPNSPKPRQ